MVHHDTPAGHEIFSILPMAEKRSRRDILKYASPTKRITALDHLSFEVAPGEFIVAYALAGPWAARAHTKILSGIILESLRARYPYPGLSPVTDRADAHIGVSVWTNHQAVVGSSIITWL